MSHIQYPTTPRPAIKLLVCALACVAALAIGGLFQPGAWYEGIEKAPWTPPNIAFPIVWTTLYVLIALSGWIVSKANDAPLIRLWWAQLVLNAAWSWLFFGEQWVWLALVDIALILGLVGMFVVKARRHEDVRFAGTLMLPYALWLVLALSLNAYIAVAN